MTPEEPRARRRSGRLLLLGFTLFLLVDGLRPPERQLSARALLGTIHLYQRTLSPQMPGVGVHCRFTPTCSHFAAGAIAKDGALVGSLRAGWRVLRCGPWTPDGTVDPP